MLDFEVALIVADILAVADVGKSVSLAELMNSKPGRYDERYLRVRLKEMRAQGLVHLSLAGRFTSHWMTVTLKETPLTHAARRAA